MALDGYAPKSPSAAIKAVSLGTSSGDSFDPKRTGTQFPKGIDRVVVWYRWSGADKSLQIDNVWYQEGESVLEQGEAVEKEAGDAAWIMKLQDGGPLDEGSYEVRLLENGTVVKDSSNRDVAFKMAIDISDINATFTIDTPR